MTEADLIAFAAFRTQESGEEKRATTRRAVIAASLVGVAAYLAVSAVATIPLLLARQLPTAGLTEALALGLGVIAGVWEWRRGGLAERWEDRRYRVKARQALARTGAHRRVWLDEAGINVAVGERSEHVGWSAVTRVEETAAHVFVYTGPASAHVIPKAADQPAATALAAAIRLRLWP